MTGLKKCEYEKRAHEVHSETTTQKSQQGEANAGLKDLVMDAECQPSEKNLRILSIFDPLEKSPGNLQVFKRRTRGASCALEVGDRKSGGQESAVRWRNEKCKMGKALAVAIGASAKIDGGLRDRGGLARFLGKFARFRDRQVAAWERARFAMRLMYGNEPLDMQLGSRISLAK
jgi:hypothetical protein